MSGLDVVGLGAMNLDRLYRVDRILTDGEALVKEHALAGGGSAANTIFGLSRLGVSCGFVGAVGDDTEGKTLLREFAEAGVDATEVTTKKSISTGSALCLADGKGRRAIYVDPGANNALTDEDIPIHYLNRASMVHTSAFVGEEQFAVQQRVLASLSPSVKISFAPGALYAAKGITALAPVLGHTHILFINRREIEELTGEDYVAASQVCLAHGCRIVVVTLGRGTKVPGSTTGRRTANCYINDGGKECYAYPIRGGREAVVDTTGAGDAFVAGFIYGFLRGSSLEECGLLGDLVARFAISRLGARPGLPTLQQLLRHYRDLYE